MQLEEMELLTVLTWIEVIEVAGVAVDEIVVASSVVTQRRWIGDSGEVVVVAGVAADEAVAAISDVAPAPRHVLATLCDSASSSPRTPVSVRKIQFDR